MQNRIYFRLTRLIIKKDIIGRVYYCNLYLYFTEILLIKESNETVCNNSYGSVKSINREQVYTSVIL